MEFDLGVNKMIVLDVDDEFPNDLRLSFNGSRRNASGNSAVRSLRVDKNLWGTSDKLNEKAVSPCFGVEMVVGFTVVLTLFIMVLIGLSVKLLIVCVNNDKTQPTDNSSSTYARWLWDRSICSSGKSDFSSSS